MLNESMEQEAFAAAMNVQSNAEGLDKLHAWSMVGTKQIAAAKARGFFRVLHDKVCAVHVHLFGFWANA